MELRLAFIGFGNVARAFARMLEARKSQLAERYGISWRVTAMATGNHGCVISDSSLDLNEAAACVERGDSLKTLAGSTEASETMSVIERCEADVLFETTPLNPESGEPAIGYIRRALGRGINVITANKSPVAFAFRELSAMARERRVAFRFEGAVMDGAPVFNMVEYCLPAVRVLGFSGALNSTTNLILTGMEEGRSFDECLDEARRAGIVEANADHDIDGWDASVKAVALTNVLMEAEAHLNDVVRQGIRNVSRDELKEAARSGMTVRLIARAEFSDSRLKLSVAPESVPLTSALGAARGTTNVLVIETDLMGEIAIFETDPGIEQTAYALLSDLMRVHEQLRERERTT